MRRDWGHASLRPVVSIFPPARLTCPARFFIMSAMVSEPRLDKDEISCMTARSLSPKSPENGVR